MKKMESDYQKQLENISRELMHFESSLRAKEKQIEMMLCTKDQVGWIYRAKLFWKVWKSS